MKGLLIKERHSLTSSCKVYLLVPAVFLAAFFFAALHRGSTIEGFPIGMIMMFMGMLPIAVCNQDMPSRWHINCLTMPYSRKQIVSAKYITCIILVAATTVLISAAICIALLLGAHFEGGDRTGFMNTMFSSIGLGFVPATIFLPPNFKFYNKPQGARLVFSALAGGMVGGSTMIVMNETQQSRSMFGGAFIYMVTVIVLFFLSWGLSLLFFRKKDA